MSLGRDFCAWAADVGSEWKKVPSLIMLVVGIAAWTIPQFERLPFYAYIPVAILAMLGWFLLWALFAVYRKQRQHIEDLCAADRVTGMGIIQLEKLWGEILFNVEQAKLKGISRTFRDEAWAFVDEGSLALRPSLRREISDFYMYVRSLKDLLASDGSGLPRVLALQKHSTRIASCGPGLADSLMQAIHQHSLPQS